MLFTSFLTLKLTFGILCGKLSWSMILSTWSYDIFERCNLVCKFVFPKFVSSKSQLYGLFQYWYFYEEVANIVRSSRKRQVTTFMTSSCDPIYQGVSLMYISNWYDVKIPACSMYKRVIASCACADVSDFKCRVRNCFYIRVLKFS